METSILKYFKGDRVIWIVLIFLSLLSLLIVYSATGALAYRVHGGNTMHYLIRQVFFIGAGLWVNAPQLGQLPTRCLYLPQLRHFT